MAIQWRRLNRALHRDIGYLAAGMTLIYALSGILLNPPEDPERFSFVPPEGAQVIRRN